MLKVDIGVCIPFVIALFLWGRGVWRRSAGDVALSAVVFAAAVALYAWLYGLASVSGVPWTAMLGGAAVAGAVLLARRGSRPRVTRAFTAAVIVVPACLSVALFFAEEQFGAAPNSLMVIEPYRHAGTWVFDDARVGLQAEPFVSGAPEIIDRLVADAGIENADKGFRLLFSARPFPGYQMKIVWRRSEFGGNWYYSEKYDAEGWLCPALFMYFKRPPNEIYVKAEAKMRISNEQ
jgi:hypothetical protein